MPTIENQGVPLHWEERGSGSPVLLIMGATYSSRLWYPVLDAFAAHHRVLLFDNRGTGQSGCTADASMADLAGDARAVLDAAGVEQADVYGVSLGGVIALELALESPDRVRSLVLGCTGILTADKPRAPKALNALFWLPRRWALALGKGGYGPAASPEAIAKDQAVLLADKTERAGLIAQQNALRGYSVSLGQVAILEMPALVLHGTADRLVPLGWGEELAATLPDSRLIRYEGAGHNYLVAAGEQANHDVLEFLAAVDLATVDQPTSGPSSS